ncbi:cbb3-type cytochrome oxidase assembly protein CcoS [Pleionea sediminis]|uniref:cbb3-type cytochrome oxidase assembly protein CcoS n=1 Tax=Pleionea sediminis TaxID=2569479 RepID=UPI001185BB1D|nr:cbb3-type cytochrome oxidase assembly protein CcoS [Pleionea sediminis]
MEVMYWLIPVAILLLAVAIAAFIWAVKNDQYSDLESPAYKILFDDDSPQSEKSPHSDSQSVDSSNSHKDD